MSSATANYPNLGQNIRSLRKAFGETQLDLALAIGANGSNLISQYESGERIPERDNLLKIAKHYRITENKLLNCNYENMRHLAHIPVGDMEYSLEMFRKMFPFVCTPEALQDQDFDKAHVIHNRMIDALKEGYGFDQVPVEECIELYKKAGKNGIVEATVNHLSWLMFLGFFTVFFTPRLLETLDLVDINNATIKDVIGGILPTFDEPGSENEFDISSDLAEFLDECEVDILYDIMLLRKSTDYSDLGDFYLALRYKLGLLRNSLSIEMNSAVGDELLLTFSLMGNKYCKVFFRNPMVTD